MYKSQGKRDCKKKSSPEKDVASLREAYQVNRDKGDATRYFREVFRKAACFLCILSKNDSLFFKWYRKVYIDNRR